MSHPLDMATVIDTERYPVGTPAMDAVTERLAAEMRVRGLVALPGFVRPGAVAEMAIEADRLVVGTHHQDVLGTPYLTPPDEDLPLDHPRHFESRSALTAVAYDQFPSDSLLRALYEWDPLMDCIAAILGLERIHRYADPFGALNVAAMHDGDELGWHFDLTDFVVSLALQASTSGGLFEVAHDLRTGDDERYDEVAAVLRGDTPERVEHIPMVPGTLLVFAGRRSLHRVTPIGGPVPRHVALLSYDTKPGTDSTDLLKLVRYGRLPA